MRIIESVGIGHCRYFDGGKGRVGEVLVDLSSFFIGFSCLPINVKVRGTIPQSVNTLLPFFQCLCDAQPLYPLFGKLFFLETAKIIHIL